MQIFKAFAVVPLLISALRADDSAKTKYTALIGGIVCQECKATVTAAVKKLPGAIDIEFARGDKPGVQKITFSSTSGTLTREDAVKALGGHAKEFEVESLSASK